MISVLKGCNVVVKLAGSHVRAQRQSLTRQCAERMKQYLIDARLQPGDRLPTEHEWVERLGVSRLVVRESLQLLAGSGLIDVQQGRGAFLRQHSDISVFDQLTFGIDLTQLDYRQVIEARAMIDLAVIELCIARAGADDLEALRAILREMERAIADDQPHEALHRAFHRQLLRAAGNPIIERVGLALMDVFWKIGDSNPNLVRSVGYDELRSHQALLDAIVQRDLDQSRAVVAAHLPYEPGATYLFPLIRLTTAASRRSEIDAHG